MKYLIARQEKQTLHTHSLIHNLEIAFDMRTLNPSTLFSLTRPPIIPDYTEGEKKKKREVANPKYNVN